MRIFGLHFRARVVMFPKVHDHCISTSADASLEFECRKRRGRAEDCPRWRVPNPVCNCKSLSLRLLIIFRYIKAAECFSGRSIGAYLVLLFNDGMRLTLTDRIGRSLRKMSSSVQSAWCLWPVSLLSRYINSRT